MYMDKTRIAAISSFEVLNTPPISNMQRGVKVQIMCMHFSELHGVKLMNLSLFETWHREPAPIETCTRLDVYTRQAL